ncbi:MAG: hypothetical protein C4523_16245 [Myxococcales bacterium]|nr:MAG: hypothetical protein C4523_16245 [Myxococcales bacterium]
MRIADKIISSAVQKTTYQPKAEKKADDTPAATRKEHAATASPAANVELSEEAQTILNAVSGAARSLAEKTDMDEEAKIYEALGQFEEVDSETARQALARLQEQRDQLYKALDLESTLLNPKFLEFIH